MRLTTKSQYGLRVLGDLIRNWRAGNGYLQVGELAARCDTSQKYLEQVLLPLSHAGVLESKRGQHGGYRLNREPSEVSLAEALRHANTELHTRVLRAVRDAGDDASSRLREAVRGADRREVLTASQRLDNDHQLDFRQSSP